MEWTAVSSTTVKAVAYEEATSTVFVEFMGGSIYRYFDVSPALYDEFMSATSKGAYFNSNIKNKFRYERG
jgi:hypothetical protein